MQVNDLWGQNQHVVEPDPTRPGNNSGWISPFPNWINDQFVSVTMTHLKWYLKHTMADGFWAARTSHFNTRRSARSPSPENIESWFMVPYRASNDRKYDYKNRTKNWSPLKNGMIRRRQLGSRVNHDQNALWLAPVYVLVRTIESSSLLQGQQVDPFWILTGQ